MKAFVILAALAAATYAPGAAACDIGRFPDMPAYIGADVIAVGRVEKQTLTSEAADQAGPAGRPRRGNPPRYTAHADIAIDGVPLGVLAQKSWRLDYPAATPEDYCVFANEGPQLKEGERVALYLRRVSGKLVVGRWVMEAHALADDPRLTGGVPRP